MAKSTATAAVQRVRNSRPLAVDPGRWHAWDAIRTAVGDQVVAVSAAMGFKGTSYIEKWRLQPNAFDNGRGIPSPLARLDDFMEACFRANRPLEKVIAPLVWLAHKWGYELTPRGAAHEADRPHKWIADSSRNDAELVARLAEYIDPDSRGGVHLTPEERQELRPLVDEKYRSARVLDAIVNTEAR